MLYQLSYASPNHPESVPEARKSVRAHYRCTRTTAQKSRLAHPRRREQTRAEPGPKPAAFHRSQPRRRRSPCGSPQLILHVPFWEHSVAIHHSCAPLGTRHAPFAAIGCSRQYTTITIEGCIPRRMPDGAGMSSSGSGSGGRGVFLSAPVIQHESVLAPGCPN